MTDNDRAIYKPELSSAGDVCDWVAALRDAGYSFHPDTPGPDYVEHRTGRYCFTDSEAAWFEQAREQAFRICDAIGTDIYELTVNVYERQA